MKNYLLALAVYLAAFAAVYPFPSAANAEQTPAQPTPESQVSEALAKNAVVVMRARLIVKGEADKYAWYEVQVLNVIKNGGEEIFREKLKVAAYSTDSGIPEGESTLYLERYNPEKGGLWKLVGGVAATGVSHTTK